MRAPWRAILAALIVAVASHSALLCAGAVAADPIAPSDPQDDFDRPRILPVVVPVPNDWHPQFPPPFDVTRAQITDADIEAEREMCQWYTAQYKAVKRYVTGLNNAVVRSHGDWNADGVGEQADIVAANLDQSVGFLTPRVDALTRSPDRAGDTYFPLYQADSFYGLWQQMSNVSNGIKSRQPTWFSGPSYHQMQFWGNKIQRSHICG